MTVSSKYHITNCRFEMKLLRLSGRVSLFWFWTFHKIFQRIFQRECCKMFAFPPHELILNIERIWNIVSLVFFFFLLSKNLNYYSWGKEAWFQRNLSYDIVLIKTTTEKKKNPTKNGKNVSNFVTFKEFPFVCIFHEFFH